LKFKIDENLPVEVAVLLVEAGHDAVTVQDQGVGGTPDAELASLCQSEERALVTLDLGFGDIRSYPPSEFPGLVVFRLDYQDKPYVLTLCRRFIATLEQEELSGSLWIVEEDQIRIRRSDEAT
jgi:predicted nuclease of predicted toxin-antitoxin system